MSDHADKIALALTESIEHWERMAADFPDCKNRPFSGHCALCNMCVENGEVNCGKCPICWHTGEWGCDQTPYMEAHETHQSFVYGGGSSTAFREAAKVEVEFLKSIHERLEKGDFNENTERYWG